MYEKVMLIASAHYHASSSQILHARRLIIDHAVFNVVEYILESVPSSKQAGIEHTS